jgi:hypothetical protein
MKRGGVIAIAIAGVLGLGPAAQAAPAAPAPTATFATSVNGQALPVSSMTGSWQVTQPGKAATLKANGVALTGTMTTIRSTWISAMRHGRGLKFACEGDFSTLAPGAAKNGTVIHIQFRTRHSGWQEFGGAGMNYSSQPLSSGGQGIGAYLAFAHPVTVRWRVQVTATYTDTSEQTFHEQVRAV